MLSGTPNYAVVSKTTEVGFDNEIDLALRAAPTSHDRQYTLERNGRTGNFVSSVRSPTFGHMLEIDTTNGIEHFHSVIKKHNNGKSLIQKYVLNPISTSILAVSKNADIRRRPCGAVGERIQEDAKRSAQNFRTQNLKEARNISHLQLLGLLTTFRHFGYQFIQEQSADELPQWKRFPLPAQTLIVEELDALRLWATTILIASTNTMKYYLPCRHIFLADCTYEILTEDVFVVIFENSGFEVYEAADGSLDRGDIGAPTRRALTPKETLEMLRSRYYEIEKGIDPEQQETR
ncbi:hypothetical protein V1505DRAFT_358484 [Lipomyces doorenjongii]